MRSYQEGASNDHITYSFQLRDVLPSDRIEALSQGTFCGYVADTFAQKVHPKIFCGEIKAEQPPKHKETVPKIVNLSEREMEEEVEKNYQKIRVDIANLLFKEQNNPA